MSNQRYERVGIRAADAIGSTLTQNTLNTFHLAGVRNDLVAQGVNRVQEIFNNSSAGKYIYKVKNGDLTQLNSLAYKTIESVGRISVLDKIDVSMREDMDKFEAQYGTVELGSIHHIIHVQFETNVYSALADFNLPPPFVILFWLERTNSLLIGLDKEYSKVTLDRVVCNILASQKLCGVDGVEQILPVAEVTYVICSKSVPLIYTLFPNVTCSKMTEMASIYGIEVAKRAMKEELTEILPGILPKHISTIVNSMCWSGSISSISRYSARVEDPLTRFSFEEVYRNIKEAAEKNQTDPLVSVSSRIVASKLV